MSKSLPPGSMPRWVKMSGMLLGAALLLMLASGHGPWRHWSADRGPGAAPAAADAPPKAGRPQ
jgi:hypothetical protein